MPDVFDLSALSGALPNTTSESELSSIFNWAFTGNQLPCLLRDEPELDEKIQSALVELKAEFKSKLEERRAKALPISTSNLATKWFQVRDMTKAEVRNKIHWLLEQYNNGETIYVPKMYNNQLYLKEQEINVYGLEVSPHLCNEDNDKNRLRVLGIIAAALFYNTCVTKRDILYCSEDIIKNQAQVDYILGFWCCTIGCTRPSLNVLASEKGLVIGKLKFEAGAEYFIDCSKVGDDGASIPNNINKIKNMEHTDAMFILVVEKDAIFSRLAQNKFYEKVPCIIITGKGVPDYASRRFLRKMTDDLNLPVLGLMDCDPSGIQILLNYKHGSENMAYDSENLAVPDIKWLGILPSDLDKYKIPEKQKHKFRDIDRKRVANLLKKDYVKDNAQLIEELNILKEDEKMVEIEGLISLGFNYLSDIFLKQKIANKSWI